jgi:hypothetical protein
MHLRRSPVRFSVGLLCLLPLEAGAQSLVFLSPPQTLPVGLSSTPMTVRRLDASGAPATTGSLTVNLSSSRAAAQFSQRFSGTWAAGLSLTITAGASDTEHPAPPP